MCIYKIFIYTKLIYLYSYFLEANLWCSFTSVWAKLFLKITFSFNISIFLLLVIWEPHKLLETWIVEFPHLICEFSVFCLLLLGLVILFARCGSAAALFLSHLYPLWPFPWSLCWLWVSMFPFYKWEFASSQSVSEKKRVCCYYQYIMTAYISFLNNEEIYSNKQFMYQAVCFYLLVLIISLEQWSWLASDALWSLRKSVRQGFIQLSHST